MQAQHADSIIIHVPSSAKVQGQAIRSENIMKAADGLPGVRTDAVERIILHVDNDCFYAACERLREPKLRGEPVVVGMGFEAGSTGGAVATASYEAREFGVESAQPISTAIETLPPVDRTNADADGPTAYYRPVDLDYYKSKAREVKAIFHDVATTVREVSIDEAYLDCTDKTTWDDARNFAEAIQQRIETDVGLPTSIGVAPNMAVAKVASDYDKPEGLVVVKPGEVAEFLAPLPIRALHGIGPKTADRFRAFELETVGDIARSDREWLRSELGDRGPELHQRANGIDPRPVEPRGDPKSLSRESSFGEPVRDPEEIEEKIQTLARDVAERAATRGATYRTIGIKVIELPYSVQTRERTLPGPIADVSIVENVALDLLEEFHGSSIRKLGVRVSNLSFAEGEQVDLDAWEASDEQPDYNARKHAFGNQLSLGAFDRD